MRKNAMHREKKRPQLERLSGVPKRIMIYASSRLPLLPAPPADSEDVARVARDVVSQGSDEALMRVQEEIDRLPDRSRRRAKWLAVYQHLLMSKFPPCC